MKDDIEFYVKLRDAAALILDACNDKLEGMGPPGTSPTGVSYDVAKITWTRAEEPRGTYEKSTDNGPDAEALRKDLQAHKGKMNVAGAFFWLWDDGKTIGRKPRGSK